MLSTFSYAWTSDCWCEERHINLTSPGYEKSYDTEQQAWVWAGWAPQIHTQQLQILTLVSPIKSYSNSLYTTKPSKQAQSHHNVIVLTMDLFLPRPANNGENQPMTNLKPRSQSISQWKIEICAKWNWQNLPVKKLKYAPKDHFSAQIYVI